MKDPVKCKDCGEEYSVQIPSICWRCHPIHKRINELFDKFKKEHAERIKKLKWYERKRFAWHILLYMPLLVFIGLKYGFYYELAWIFGGIHLAYLPFISKWLADKF